MYAIHINYNLGFCLYDFDTAFAASVNYANRLLRQDVPLLIVYITDIETFFSEHIGQDIDDCVFGTVEGSFFQKEYNLLVKQSKFTLKTTKIVLF